MDGEVYYLPMTLANSLKEFFMHSKKFTVKEIHLDTFGHVNNATYLELFEDARWDLVTERGYGLKRVRETGIGPTVLEIEIKFRQELRLRDEVLIESNVESYEGKVGKLRQKMLLKDGSLACDALFTFGLFDTGQRKLIEPNEEWLNALKD